jgi:hypothetical protein
MGAMKSPQPRNLVMEPVIPILGQVIGYAKDQYSPIKRHPLKEIVIAWQQGWEHRHTEPGKEWAEHKFGECKAGNVDGSFMPAPRFSIHPYREFEKAECEYEPEKAIPVY